MRSIPELTQACKLNDRIARTKTATTEDEKRRRALWLIASSKGATREQIQQMCGVSQSLLEGELRKARAETDDPKLAKMRSAKGGLTLGVYWCPVKGCARSEGNGGEPLGSAQGLGMHKVAAHGYKLGENKLTAAMVRKARADTSTPTRELARKWKVSPHALGAARAGKTWRNVA